MTERRIVRLAGRAVALRGDHIDTDRIIPARFLRAVTFEGLEAHVFEDDRAQRPDHPFSNPVSRGASILLVNANFGCGSSREHAPQALHRWGIQAIVGQSFSEIFFGNSVALGLPCVTAAAETLETLMRAVEANPALEVTLSLADLQVAAAGESRPVTLAPGVREAFVTGAWDATGLLLDREDEVGAIRARLPYITGFQGST
jgi:3-isopropylmalate/(R)-2-methylmalate dehydratase small subunit